MIYKVIFGDRMAAPRPYKEWTTVEMDRAGADGL
jgi:hypothetical protein